MVVLGFLARNEKFMKSFAASYDRFNREVIQARQ